MRARDLWSRGHLSAALSTLEALPGSGALRARLRSQLAMMSPGFHLPHLSPSPGWTTPDPGEPLRVLHLLTSSLPHTQSGYTVRSHALLQAQSDAGIDVRAVTRIGYPVIIGRPSAQGTDVVDAVTYRRLLPARTQAAPIARLAQMSHLLAREVEAFRPHLLHTTTNYVNALVTQAVARSFGLPWVYEMRGVLECTWVASRPVSQQAEALSSERFALLRAKEAEMARRSDAVVVLSQVQAEDLAARGVEPSRITVVPNAVEQDVLEATRYSPAAARQRLGLPPRACGWAVSPPWWVMRASTCSCGPWHSAALGGSTCGAPSWVTGSAVPDWWPWLESWGWSPRCASFPDGWSAPGPWTGTRPWTSSACRDWIRRCVGW